MLNFVNKKYSPSHWYRTGDDRFGLRQREGKWTIYANAQSAAYDEDNALLCEHDLDHVKSKTMKALIERLATLTDVDTALHMRMGERHYSLLNARGHYSLFTVYKVETSSKYFCLSADHVESKNGQAATDSLIAYTLDEIWPGFCDQVRHTPQEQTLIAQWTALKAEQFQTRHGATEALEAWLSSIDDIPDVFLRS